MSLLVRPAIRIRSTGCFIHPESFRHFSIASRALLEAGKPQHASTATAMATHAPATGDQTSSSVKVVGAELPAAEGPHYQDHMTVMTDNELTHPSRIGAWTLFNPIYTQAEMNTVKIVHRPAQTVGDKVAHGVVKLLRRMFDLATGYRSIPIPDHVLKMDPLPVKELRKKGLLLSDKNWLLRIILLESVAGVPGMVGGTLRHLRSLRSLRRDGGWIHTLLEEAENERMHLLTFMTIAQPTAFTRALILAAQGTFYNAFFLTYLISPTLAHRFVGALEEEAVRTYTHCIEDIERGLVPEWQNVPAPRIAIDYWRLPESATLLDVMRAVRADEATHRFVNHSLANLDQKRDFNPFALGEASAEIRGTKYGFTREESAEFATTSQQKLMKQAHEEVDPPRVAQ